MITRKIMYKVSFYLMTGKLEVFLDDRQAEKFSEKLFDVWDDYRNKSQRKKRKVCFSGIKTGVILCELIFKLSYNCIVYYELSSVLISGI